MDTVKYFGLILFALTFLVTFFFGRFEQIETAQQRFVEQSERITDVEGRIELIEESLFNHY